MKTTWNLTRRNLAVFFRDVGSVCLSLIGALVLFVLYVGFLGGLQVSNLHEKLPHASIDDINWFVTTWVFAGIVMITTVTTGIAGLGIFVGDRSSGGYRDFLVSPVRSWQLVFGYLLSSAIVSILMSSVVLVLGEFYLLFSGHPVASIVELLTTFALIVLLSLSFAGLSAFVVTFLKTHGAFAALSTVAGTLVGFLAGAYLPLGLLPSGVVNVINALPFSLASQLLRLPLTGKAVDAITGGQPQAVDAVNAYYGIQLKIGEFVVEPALSSSVLVIILVIFTTLAAGRIRNVLRK